MSIKDFFIKQMINNNDFGKINIMPNGDVHSNINYPALGNICTHSIFVERNRRRKILAASTQSRALQCMYLSMAMSVSF